jgi:hypothetical protein
MIGLGYLLLVVPHLFAVAVSVSWVRLPNSKITKLGYENIFAGSHIEHCWRCS